MQVGIEQVYACACGRAIQRDFVEGVIPGGELYLRKTVVICYRCECSPHRERVARFHAHLDAVERLTHGQGLPYRNRCPLVPVPVDHPAVEAWREFIDRHGHDVEQFITALNC
jgi:hypothetical protein